MKIRRSLRSSSAKVDVLTLFRAACAAFHESPALKSMRGNTKSRLLLIAPPPTPDEMSSQLPLTGEASKALHFALLNTANFNTESDSLVVSCSFSESGNKSATEPIARFVRACAKARLFDRYAIIGSQAFKQLFGDGKAPTMHTMSGSVLYLEALNGTPLFVFPDITNLVVVAGTVFKSRRDESIAYRQAEELQTKLASQVIPKFQAFLK